MNWIESIDKAIKYIENNLNENITIADIASNIFMSPFYFQRGFNMLCGFTVGEYIKSRRLTLAGSDLAMTKEKIIDIAIKYGYDSPDSFTKAFTRFHGVTPTSVRKNGAKIKIFSPLIINFTLQGGFLMDYKIIEKEAFTVLGVQKKFKYEDAMDAIPKFWQEHYKTGKGNVVCGTYGVNIDANMTGHEFEYLIADNYNPASEIPDGFVARVIPKHTWAVFSCTGAMPNVMQETNKKIFTQWLPSCKDYVIAEGYNIEMYSAPQDFKDGTQDENYYSEIWIPIKKA